MISYALITNGQYNPFLNSPLPDHMKYPISQNCSEGIDLDYSALLIGENFIIDEAVYDEILASRKKYFRPMKKTLKELKINGLLKCEDYSSIFELNKNKIIKITDMLLENPTVWLELEQTQWATLKDELKVFQNTYGTAEMKRENTGNIGIESWLSYSDQYYNFQLRTDLYDLFECKKNISDLKLEDVRGALKFIVAQIVMSDLISNTLKVPVLDWDDSKNMYERLYSVKWNDYAYELGLREQSSKLFNIVMPDLKPNNIEAVIHFICDDKAVATLRRTLSSLIDEDMSVSQEWMVQYVNQIMSADLALQKKSSIFQLFGTVLGVIPGPWIQSATIAGVSTAANSILFPKPEGYEWYYALQSKCKTDRIVSGET